MAFQLNIDTSNMDAVREALLQAIQKLDQGIEAGRLRDENGNTIGSFEFEAEEEYRPGEGSMPVVAHEAGFRQFMACLRGEVA